MPLDSFLVQILPSLLSLSSTQKLNLPALLRLKAVICQRSSSHMHLDHLDLVDRVWSFRLHHRPPPQLQQPLVAIIQHWRVQKMFPGSSQGLDRQNKAALTCAGLIVLMILAPTDVGTYLCSQWYSLSWILLFAKQSYKQSCYPTRSFSIVCQSHSKIIFPEGWFWGEWK